MQKAKKYDWTDSNLALFGSDTEKQVKKESAESEPAWSGAGQDVGVQIWRINKFKVEQWPKEDYGEFFNGDSYIILNTYKKPGEDDLEHDLHFWIGKYSTQDEYGTAAYKTVELDTLLDDKPVQHREVQGHESPLFKKYFPEFTLMKGGCDTGFNRVLPEAYTPRLFHIKKIDKKHITCTEVSLKKGSYKEEDVFILDTGLTIYQINGDNCSHDEKFSAAQQANKLISNRGKAHKEIIDGNPFGNSTVAPYFKDGEKKEKAAVEEWGGDKLLKLETNADRDLVSVAEGGDINKDLLDPADCFLLDTANMCFVWIGAESSVDERKNAMPLAANYLNKTAYPFHPITIVAQGKESAEFNACF